MHFSKKTALVILPIFFLLGAAPALFKNFSSHTTAVFLSSLETPPHSELSMAAPRVSPRSSSAGITAQSLQNCLRSSAEKINPCLDALFRVYLKTYSSKDALALIEKIGDADSALRVSCHPVTHAIGRETFLQKKTIHDSFAACDQTCHSGCYHGAMERFLRGDAAEKNERHVTEDELSNKVSTACNPGEAVRFRFQCLHGLGHALMFFLDYKLEKSLALCDTTGDAWSRSSCYGGAFMENVFSATPEKRDLNAHDYHYPCNKLDTQYKNDCYMMQTTRMAEMGLSTPQLFDECRKAGVYSTICAQSIGRDLSNDVRAGAPQMVAQKCEQIVGEERNACIRGVIYALMDNTWDGRFSFPFCQTLHEASDQTYCFRASNAYLRATYEKTTEELIQQCKKYTPLSEKCNL